MQAIREFYSIQQHADVGLAATAALLTAHQAAKVVDENAVLQLSAYLQVSDRKHQVVVVLACSAADKPATPQHTAGRC